MRSWMVAAGAILCGAGVVATAAVTEIDRYNTALRVAERDTANAAVLAAAHAEQVFAGVRASLQGVESIRQDVLAGRITGRRSIAKLLDSVRGDSAVIHSVGWTDANGLQVGRSMNGPLPAKPVDMSKAEHFLYFRDAPPGGRVDGMHISKPIRAKLTGDWILIVSTRLANPDGGFAGVAGAALDPLYFASVYDRIALGPSRVATLYRDDGTVLARTPEPAAWIGRTDSAAVPLFRDRLPAAPAGSFRQAGTGGQAGRIVSYRAVPGLPLVVAVSLSTADALAPFYAGLRGNALSVALILVFLGGGAWLAEVRVRERQRAQAALAASEARYRVLADLSPVGVFRTDADGNAVYVNSRWCEIAGMTDEQARGSGWRAALHPDDRERVLAEWQSTIAAGEVFSSEFRFRKPDGEVTWVFGQSAAMADEAGRPAGYVGTVTDTTRLKEAEEGLRRAQRLEAVGQLTGGIAHDFNNLLGVILGQAELLAPLVQGDPKGGRRVDTLIRAVHRGADLTRRLLGFSRTRAHESMEVSVNGFVRGMENLIAKSLTPAVRVEMVLAADTWPVAIDPGDLEDALLNLSINARDAMPDGGTLVIETANQILDATYAAQNPGSRPGEFVMISVSDTGTGMPAEVRDKAFEPFFTTKEEGRGTGLGLSMVYGFVQRSDGHAKIYSEPGHGTAVHLYLPRAHGAAGESAVRAASTEVPRGDETILVVDDEPGLVDAAATFLQSLGYRTQSAMTIDGALEILQAEPAVDLLFSDVILPGGRDGYDLAIAARELRPGLRILLTSGFTRGREESTCGPRPIVTGLARSLLHKPYAMADLARAVRQALDG